MTRREYFIGTTARGDQGWIFHRHHCKRWPGVNICPSSPVQMILHLLERSFCIMCMFCVHSNWNTFFCGLWSRVFAEKPVVGSLFNCITYACMPCMHAGFLCRVDTDMWVIQPFCWSACYPSLGFLVLLCKYSALQTLAPSMQILSWKQKRSALWVWFD